MSNTNTFLIAIVNFICGSFSVLFGYLTGLDTGTTVMVAFLMSIGCVCFFVSGILIGNIIFDKSGQPTGECDEHE